nr:hypothetical protein [uncultured Capnocytophaga sp.]
MQKNFLQNGYFVVFWVVKIGHSSFALPSVFLRSSFGEGSV